MCSLRTRGRGHDVDGVELGPLLDAARLPVRSVEKLGVGHEPEAHGTPPEIRSCTKELCHLPKLQNQATGLNRFDKSGYEMISPLGHRSVFAARAANDPRDKEDVKHRAHEGGGHE